MDRTEDTKFGRSTYDEMCIISLFVTFETPPLNTIEGAASDINFSADLDLRTFNCDVDEETDVWQGILNEDEDARNIYFDHPIAESDMCTFPVANFALLDTALTQRTR